MPQLNHKGPEGKGTKTGRKLGLCNKTNEEQNDTGLIGEGMAKRRHSGGGEGKGKRINYTKNK